MLLETARQIRDLAACAGGSARSRRAREEYALAQKRSCIQLTVMELAEPVGEQPAVVCARSAAWVAHHPASVVIVHLMLATVP
jgi:1,4-dihydroxy-2-naphthoyl-CoA synthase